MDSDFDFGAYVVLDTSGMEPAIVLDGSLELDVIEIVAAPGLFDTSEPVIGIFGYGSDVDVDAWANEWGAGACGTITASSFDLLV